MFIPGLEVKAYFQVQRTVYRSLGIDINSMKVVQPWKTVLLASSLTLLPIFMGRYCYQHIGELDKIADTLAQSIQLVLANIKVYMLLYKRKSIANLIKRIQLLSMKASEDELAILAKENRREVFLSGLYYKIVRINFVAVFATPFALTAYYYHKTGEIILVAPIKASYPLDQQNPYSYCLIFVLCWLAIFCMQNCSVGSETTFCWSVCNLAAHFQILQHKLAKVAEKYSDDCDNLEALELALNRCIQFHQHILDIANEFAQCFQLIMLAEFALNAGQISFIAYQLGVGTSFASIPIFLVFLLGVLLQLMIYCYGGQVIQNESEDIVYAVYNTIQWKKWPVKLQRLSTLFMMRAQQPCKLSGIFFEANLPLFMTIVQTSTSYITLLRSIE